MYRPTLQGSAVPYEDWKDDALCDGLPPEWFEISDDLMDRPGCAEDDQHDLIAKGLRVCNDCPVKSSCLSNSKEIDRIWTTRGGFPPGYLFGGPDRTSRSGKGGTKGPKVTYQRGKKCKREHDNWADRPDGRVFCYTCKQITDAGQQKKRASRNRHPKVIA
jgi:hypothetical protein